MAKWEEQWQHAKKTFKANTGQKKPSQKLLFGIAKSTGIEAALNKCDISDGDISKDKKGALAEFAKAIAEYKQKAAEYGKVLIAAMEGPERVTLKPDIDLLTKNLNALGATLDAHLKVRQVQASGANSKELMAKTVVSSLRGSIPRAILFAAQVKNKKDPKDSVDFFNANIVKAARDITQQIGNFEKLRTLGYKFPKGDPTNLCKVMTPWANAQRTLKVGTQKEQIAREVGAFLQAVEGVRKWTEAS